MPSHRRAACWEEADVQKATIRMITAKSPNDVAIEVMFNPTEYQITRNMNYADVNVPGLTMPIVQFVRGDSQVLQLELFLDSSDRKQPSPLAGLSPGGAAPSK